MAFAHFIASPLKHMAYVILPFLLVVSVFSKIPVEVHDVFIPNDCYSIAKAGDHLLIEYEILSLNGTVIYSDKRPKQLFHMILETSEDYPLHANLKGMCENSTRKISWGDADDADILSPLPQPVTQAKQAAIVLTIVHITVAEDYAIFDAFRIRNTSLVMDFVNEKKGVNAVDEWGQTPLMIAAIQQNLPVFASLLNAHRPSVNVNMAKPTGMTALIYAVQYAPSAPTMVQALLRRGADPNAAVAQEGSRGNTALHFACLLEKSRHAELLLEYGANPYTTNEYGKTALELLPGNTPTSVKQFFRRIFDDAKRKLSVTAKTALGDSNIAAREGKPLGFAPNSDL